VARLAAHEKSTQGARGADAEGAGDVVRAEGFAAGEGGEVGSVAFARVVDLVAGGAEGV